jgi:hypothetical protein
VQLREALEQTPFGTLRRIASQHGLPHDDSTTRTELIERIGERLLASTYLDEQVARLVDDERAVLVAARASAGELRGLLIDRDHPGVAEALTDRGLLFRVFASAGPLRGEVFAVPDELLERLPAPPPAEAPPVVGPPSSAERRASDPVFSLFALVSAVVRGGGHLEQDVRGWSEEPGGWDWEARWAFLRHLAQAAGLLVQRADGAPAASPGLIRLLDRPAELADRLWRTYLADRGWLELAHAGVASGGELAEAVPLRLAIVEALQQLPENVWTDLDAFVAWLERTRPDLVRQQLNARGVVELESVPWAALEAPLLRYCLLGPLYWLGLVGASADGRLVVRRARSVPISPEACDWQGPAELLAPARAQLGTLLQAETYLVLHERSRLSRYHLVQAHVAAALGGGGSIDECRRLLVRLTQAELPSQVAERLAAWEDRFGAVAVRPAVLIEARSAAELDDAIADERVRPFVRARVGPTVAEVPAGDVLELAAKLREAGHLPRVDAALRLAAEPRRAYAGLVDEQVLEFLLVSLLAFQLARPEQLARLEGSLTLLDRLERQFPRERLAELRAAAARLAGELGSSSPRVGRLKRPRRRRKS